MGLGALMKKLYVGFFHIERDDNLSPAIDNIMSNHGEPVIAYYSVVRHEESFHQTRLHFERQSI